VLVEAKANWAELSTAGKLLSSGATSKSRENHESSDRRSVPGLVDSR